MALEPCSVWVCLVAGVLGSTLGCGPGTARAKLVAEPGAGDTGDTGGTLGSEGIAGERGALGISSRACVQVESLKNFS